MRLPVGLPDVPDPAGMLKRLHERGLQICVWINPYIAPVFPALRGGRRIGYLLRGRTASVWQTDQWQPGMGIVDFTNPAARYWFAGPPQAPRGDGSRRFKSDFGERIPTDVVYHDGSDPVKMHNLYPVLYNEAVFDLLEQERGKGRRSCLRGRPTRRARGSRCIGAATATRRSNRWRRACGGALARPLRVWLLEPRHRGVRGARRRSPSTSGGSLLASVVAQPPSRKLLVPGSVELRRRGV